MRHRPVVAGRERARHAHAVVGDRRVGVGHLERRDALLAGRRASWPGCVESGVRMPMRARHARDPPRAHLAARARRTPSCPTSSWPCAATRRRVVVVVVVRPRTVAARDGERPCGCETNVRLGADARPRARATRVNGLNAEPGWRWPLVARLNGAAAKSVPPTIALTSPVLFSIATSDALGPTPASRPAIACSAAAWSSGSSVVRIFRPPPNTTPGPVAVHELLGQPAREVGLARVRRAAGRSRLACGSAVAIAPPAYSPAVIMLLLEHALRARGRVALGRARVVHRVVDAWARRSCPASSAASAG